MYLHDALKFSENDSTVIYHAFMISCYFMPILGALLADGTRLGKFK